MIDIFRMSNGSNLDHETILKENIQNNNEKIKLSFYQVEYYQLKEENDKYKLSYRNLYEYI